MRGGRVRRCADVSVFLDDHGRVPGARCGMRVVEWLQFEIINICFIYGVGCSVVLDGGEAPDVVWPLYCGVHAYTLETLSA